MKVMSVASCPLVWLGLHQEGLWVWIVQFVVLEVFVLLQTVPMMSTLERPHLAKPLEIKNFKQIKFKLFFKKRVNNFMLERSLMFYEVLAFEITKFQ